MRIRKNASKLLGSAILYVSAPFSPPSDTWDPPSPLCSSSGEFCALNQSPWDLYPNLHLFASSYAQEEAKEEKVLDAISENDKDILGNSAEKETAESEDKPLQVCKRVDVLRNKEKKTATKKKKVNKNQSKKTNVMLCKKNDGRNWFCKRPAKVPHSYCEYHYSLSRTCTSTNREKEASKLKSLCKRSEKKEKVGVSTNPYYYYSGFWPSNIKTRGTRNAANREDAVHVSVDDDEKKVDGRDASSVEGRAREDCAVDDDEVISGSDGEEKKVCRKRRRNTTKCRSLRSLMQ